MKAWYLLYCKPRNEFRAQQNLALQGVESYLPMLLSEPTSKSKSAKSTPLFPCYLFAFFDPQEFPISRIHSTRGVARLVGCKEMLVPIDESIVNGVKTQEQKVRREVVSLAHEPLMRSGDKVVVHSGPFSELEGIFDETCGNKRCHVLFTIMGQTKRISVPQADLKRVCA
ncbi:transcription/translation regulatory transformer protein RfaH [Shewanella gelidii]|uniref:Transcription antitermination protein RfaH n=1 Tax=Shewanella gelidii TaxID=1642821 RepID=A0A917JGS6_9GAMM|nr:transcription/translation regulatory transformer protein RfaH [Shewanella gelidii]MCL1096433.1 transcription/translation regulatory transformer protein RfaH [Shewanella gelidii]GGI67378.1 transcription antitermination protein RfaH [Shewanella gelidii]